LTSDAASDVLLFRVVRLTAGTLDRYHRILALKARG
jgi:hypothetical protein